VEHIPITKFFFWTKSQAVETVEILPTATIFPLFFNQLDKPCLNMEKRFPPQRSHRPAHIVNSLRPMGWK
jgi:hypothetical protein